MGGGRAISAAGRSTPPSIRSRVESESGRSMRRAAADTLTFFGPAICGLRCGAGRRSLFGEQSAFRLNYKKKGNRAIQLWLS